MLKSNKVKRASNIIKGLHTQYRLEDFCHNQNMQSFPPLVVGQEKGSEHESIFLPNKIPKLLCIKGLIQSQEQFYQENRYIQAEKHFFHLQQCR